MIYCQVLYESNWFILIYLKSFFLGLLVLFKYLWAFYQNTMRYCVLFQKQVRVWSWSSRYLQYDEELISGLSLHYNLLAVLELDGLQGVSHRQALPLVKRLWGRRKDNGRTQCRWQTNPEGGGGDFCFKQDIFKLSQVILISWRRRDDAPPRLFLSRKTWRRANAPKMDTFLRNSSYIFLFLKVLPCRGKTLH